MTRIAYRCDKCGSTECGDDANTVWDIDTQAWVLGGVYDSTWCTDCGDDIGLELYDPDDPTDVFVAG